MARDFILLAEQLKVEADLKEKLEVKRGDQGERLEETFKLLTSMNFMCRSPRCT